jgi:hypothetical protein
MALNNKLPGWGVFMLFFVYKIEAPAGAFGGFINPENNGAIKIQVGEGFLKFALYGVLFLFQLCLVVHAHGRVVIYGRDNIV